MAGWMAGQMLVRRSRADGRAAGLVLGRQDLAERGHVLDRDDDLQLQRLARAGIDDGDLAVRADAAEEAGDGLERPLGRAQADALERRRVVAAQALEALEAQGQVRAALACRRWRGPRRR